MSGASSSQTTPGTSVQGNNSVPNPLESINEVDKGKSHHLAHNDKKVTTTPNVDAHVKKTYISDNLVDLRNSFDALSNEDDIFSSNEGVVLTPLSGSKEVIDSDSEVDEIIDLKGASGTFKDDDINKKEASTSTTTVSHV